MKSQDAARLKELSASLASRHSVVQLAREQLIEAVGDRMCGSGSGPTSQELQDFSAARRQEAIARCAMARFVAKLARDLIARIRRGSRQARSTVARRKK